MTLRLLELGYNIKFSESAIDYISKVGFDDLYGARPLKRAIQEKFEDFLSDEVLKDNVVIDKEYEIVVEDEDVKVVEVTEKKVKKVKKKQGE